MMGVGKSTIGRYLSKKLGMAFDDLDEIIEKNTSLSISKIFESKGEKQFRLIEEEISLKILKKSGRVVALGGGTFLNERVRKTIKKNSYSFWLNLPPNQIFKRIKKSQKRPLLKNAKSEKDVEKIYMLRKKIYSLADYEVDCLNKSRDQIVNNIKNIYENI